MPGQADIALGNEALDMLLYFTGVTFPTLAANASASNTLTIPGVQVGDLASIAQVGPGITHLEASSAYVSAANTLTIWWNSDASGITGASNAIVLVNIVRPSRPYNTLPNAVT